ncbi:hypothetical protein VNO77_16204 [Canavalia gladiata]|uniref:J domain-containing protein n=1 Tax=Canavalia gladiata TaxID=3824 RepID=A0AAN9M539_CANGL
MWHNPFRSYPICHEYHSVILILICDIKCIFNFIVSFVSYEIYVVFERMTAMMTVMEMTIADLEASVFSPWQSDILLFLIVSRLNSQIKVKEGKQEILRFKKDLKEAQGLTSILSYKCLSATPFIAGVAVAAAAYAGRYGIQAWQALKARPPRARRFYEGGFQASMTRREAALILGVREHTPTDKIKEAHRRVMVANHPDAGGSHYLASKINEAKDMLLGKTKGGSSAF